MNLSDLELGWLAGILEGEGCFLMSDERDTSQRITIEMVDEDVINRVALLVERLTGRHYNVSIRDPKTGFANAQQRYVLQLVGGPARIVMRAIVRHMGYRRRQRIWQCLNGFKPKKVDLINILQIRKDPAA